MRKYIEYCILLFATNCKDSSSLTDISESENFERIQISEDKMTLTRKKMIKLMSFVKKKKKTIQYNRVRYLIM